MAVGHWAPKSSVLGTQATRDLGTNSAAKTAGRRQRRLDAAHVAREFPDVRLIRQGNIGFSAANNLALRESEARGTIYSPLEETDLIALRSLVESHNSLEAASLALGEALRATGA